MAVGTGYSKIATDGLVFAYDTKDQRNSYKGKPAYNVLGTPVAWVGNNNTVWDSTHYFITTTGTETVNIPALGTYNNVQYVTINNGYTGYGDGGNYNCCPSFFRYGDWGISSGVTGGTLYTYSIIYKCQSGYYNSNYMYHYEYGNSGYITEYGVFDGSKRVDLGDGWYWAYNTFTTNAACTTIYPGMWYYQYNTPDKVWLLGAMLVQGDYKVPPLNFLSGYETRSNTQGLLNIVPTVSAMDISNVSFDSDAQMYFDGINDFISIPNTTSLGNFTAEVIVNPSSYPGNAASAISTEYPGSNSTVNYTIGFDGSNWMAGFYNGSSGGWHQITTSLPALNVYSHYVLTYNGTQMALYKNGILVGTLNTTDIAAGGNPIRIGRRWDIGDYFPGKIDVAKVYNRALTEGEIVTNYNHYKTRFKLPGIVYSYNEWNRADLYTGYWNNSTTYNMTDFGGLGNVTAHGFSSGPVTYTLTLGDLPTHTKVRYKVYWHLVDSLDNETNQLFIMNSSGGETEILRFTKQYNLSPSISIAASPGTYTWSGSKTYSYRPWANGAYNADGYIIVDSGWVDHTASSFTARHVMGADQAQADEAEYLSHVEVQLFG